MGREKSDSSGNSKEPQSRSDDQSEANDEKRPRNDVRIYDGSKSYDPFGTSRIFRLLQNPHLFDRSRQKDASLFPSNEYGQGAVFFDKARWEIRTFELNPFRSKIRLV
jgi:hypothetical protein